MRGTSLQRAALTAALGLALAVVLAVSVAASPMAMGMTGPGTMPSDPGTMPMNSGAMPTGPGTMPMESGSGGGHMFPDATGTWYEQYAGHMSTNGFMAGFADGRFGGDSPLTRGQFAGIMARMMGIEPAGGSSFTDTRGFWGEGHVNAMAQRGIILGREDGTFGPYNPVTRAHMATMLDRAWSVMHGSGTPGGEWTREQMNEMRRLMGDVGGHWAEAHIGRMFMMGVVGGDGRGHFRPDQQASRAQGSAMMWRWWEAHLAK
jgi:hypothetical protein